MFLTRVGISMVRGTLLMRRAGHARVREGTAASAWKRPSHARRANSIWNLSSAYKHAPERHCTTWCAQSVGGSSPPIDVLVMVEATAKQVKNSDFETVAERIEEDAQKVVLSALQNCRPEHASPKPHELSIVLCDDEYMAAVNNEWRGQNRPTDVLSFEIPRDEFTADLPVVTLGDIIISLETAHRQAVERQPVYGADYSMYDEVRVLLVHGLLHLLGFDHELGPEAAKVMADQEAILMAQQGWEGQGLIDAVNSRVPARDSNGDDVRWAQEQQLQVVCLDMDGTLLNSKSEFSKVTVNAVQRCLGLPNVTVMLATGKARPAAIAACEKVGLAGPGGLVHSSGPGVFLQGLATYGPDGELLEGAALSWSVVEACFLYSEAQNVALCAFLGDECVTTRMSPFLEELHVVYYEPLSQVITLDEIMAGPAVKKLLFMSSPAQISEQVMPDIEANLVGTDAESTQAVDSMLEVVPKGVNKWTGISKYLKQAGLGPSNVLAIGDGMNDYHMLLNAGCSVAMENAKQPVKDVADKVTASNDHDGVAKALESEILGLL